MRIAYIVRHIDSAGGRERVVTNKANYLAQRLGYDVFIVTMFQEEHRTVFALNEKVHVRHLKLPPRGLSFWNRLRYSMYVKRAIESELERISPDITISMWWGPEFKLLPFMSDGSRKVLEFHSSAYMRRYKHRPSQLPILGQLRWVVTNWLDERIVGKYDKFVVLTNEDRGFWKARNTVVIPNSLSFVCTSTSDCASRIVLSAGRLTESKGFDRLIEIWAAIEADYPDWSLRILGDGEERENLNRLIKAKGLNRVSLLPATRNIADEMLRASIFALTSRYEGFGMVLIEAMQCGLPVVSYKTRSGPAEIIDDGTTGFLVDEDDEILFAQRLRCLMDDVGFRQQIGAAAKVASERKYSERIVMKKWDRLFRQYPSREGEAH